MRPTARGAGTCRSDAARCPVPGPEPGGASYGPEGRPRDFLPIVLTPSGLPRPANPGRTRPERIGPPERQPGPLPSGTFAEDEGAPHPGVEPYPLISVQTRNPPQSIRP